MALSLLGAGSGAGAASSHDAFFSSTVLLMGFEGADASQGSPGMTDESGTTNKGTAFNVAGNAQIDTAQFKFGASSLLLDGSGDGIRFADNADYNLAAGSFTIESWIRPNTVAAGTYFIVGQWQSTGNLGWIFYQSGATLGWNVSTTGSDNLNDLTGGVLTTGAWFHACVDFDGTKFRMYLNGAMVASSTTLRTIANSTNALSIGSSNLIGSSYNGWIDELRITKGVARYGSDSGFSVPTAAFPRSA